MYKRLRIRMTSHFSSEILEARRLRIDSFKILCFTTSYQSNVRVGKKDIFKQSNLKIFTSQTPYSGSY